jgi:hypothetical protein
MDLDSLKRMLEIFEMVSSRSKIKYKQDRMSEFLEKQGLLDLHLSNAEGVEL